MRGNKYVIVIVEFNSNTIVVEPMKSCHDDKMKQDYEYLLSLQLKQASITPKKHILNKVSNSMKGT